MILLASLGLYGQWITGYYEMGTGVPQISDIPWNYYTQIIAFAAVPNSDGTINMYGLSQSGNNALMASRPVGKKVIVELADSGCCWSRATSRGTVATFVNNIVNFVNAYGFDGVDLDWEQNINSTQYVDLVTLLRTALPTKLISMAVNGDLVSVVANNQSKLDQVNALCYDMDFAAGSTSWYNGPIYGPPLQWSCSALTGQLTAAGVPAAKISVGIPFYGRKWTGCTQVLFSPCTMQTYELYRDMVADTTRWQSQYRHYDTQYMSNYLSIPSLNEFHSYNGVEFMPDVASWRKSSGLGSFTTFSIGYEYLSSQTGNARYPLSSALYNAVFGSGIGTITNFTPSSGAVGTSVILTGTNFTGATAVTFNGTSAVFTVNSGTQITATVPAGATTGPIGVTTPGGTSTSSTNFSVSAAAPAITSFAPSSGAEGTSVTLTGTNFTGATAVTFNGTSAVFTVNSGTQITATVPTGATTGLIGVTTPGGTATSSTNFTVLPAAPTITSFTPSSGAVGTMVIITGSNFTGATAVTFNGASAVFTVNSGTQITATVPTGATTGLIGVTTPGGTASSSTNFTVSAAAPTITSFAPSSGAVGTSVTLTGTNFTGATAVTFNGASAVFTVNSGTQITATVPAGATTGPIGSPLPEAPLPAAPTSLSCRQPRRSPASRPAAALWGPA
jgi:uncharacterized protein YjbI with pentapeptide repeats